MQARSLHSRPCAPRATRARARTAARGVAPAPPGNMRPLRGSPRTRRARDAGPGHAAVPHHVPAHWLPGWPVPPLRRLQCAGPPTPPPACKGRAAPPRGVQARLKHVHASSGVRQTPAPGQTQGRGTSASGWRRSGRTLFATGARCAAAAPPRPWRLQPSHDGGTRLTGTLGGGRAGRDDHADVHHGAGLCGLQPHDPALHARLLHRLVVTPSSAAPLPCASGASSGPRCARMDRRTLRNARPSCRVFWRYNVLYVSERCFESGGLFWDQIFSQVRSPGGAQ